MSAARRQHGFTLVELLVVLAILTALSTVAVRAVANNQDQRRFETSQRVVQDVSDAIVGGRAVGATAVDHGFLGDMGRLPAAPTLMELCTWSDALTSSHIATDTDDAAITLAVGWRGPYLLLPFGATELRDGFDNPLDVVVGTAPDTFLLRSLGANAAVDVVPPANYDRDLTIVLRDAMVERVRAEVVGTVVVETDPGIPPPWTVTVCAYEPDLAEADHIRGHLEDLDTDPDSPTTFPASFQFRFSDAVVPLNGITAGPRILRAYAHATGSDPWTGTRRSAPSLRVLVGGAQNVELRIP